MSSDELEDLRRENLRLQLRIEDLRGELRSTFLIGVVGMILLTMILVVLLILK